MFRLRDVAIGTNLAGNQEHMGSFTNQNKAELPPPTTLIQALSTSHAEVSIMAVTMHVNRAFC